MFSALAANILTFRHNRPDVLPRTPKSLTNGVWISYLCSVFRKGSPQITQIITD